MRPVQDAFLLNLAEVSSALIGLFLVGMLFFAESGFRRLGRTREVIEPYYKAITRIVLALYAIPLGLSLSLVVLELVWSRVLFALLSLVLVAANVDSATRIVGVARMTGSIRGLVAEGAGTLTVIVVVVLPWALGGLHPTREDLTWAILLSFATGFVSVCATVLSVFDLPWSESATGPDGEGG
jgi:hypothetical protein